MNHNISCNAMLKYFGGSRFFSYVLLWLIVVLVMGTISQQSLGLFLAQEKYFFSWFFFVGFIPLPAGMTTLAVITISLAIKMFYLQKTWQKKKFGTIIAHLASLGLLLGGFVVALVSQHGNMAVTEGARSHIISNPYRTELALIDGAGATIATFPEAQLQAGATLNLPLADTHITIEDYFQNSRVSRRRVPLSENNTRGMLMNIHLASAPRAPQEEDNFAGLIFTLTQPEESKRLGIFEHMPIAQTLTDGKGVYTLSLRRQQTALPFSIELVDFIQEFYPGTTNARGYSSRVILHDGENKWPAIIAMNEPLRYKGFTLYQASFVDFPDGQTSIFAVVENRARLLPYITSIILCLGLLIHLFIRLPKLHPNLKRKKA